MTLYNKLFFVIVLASQICLTNNDFYVVDMPGKQAFFKSLQDYIDFRESLQNKEQLPDPGDLFAQQYQTQPETAERWRCYYRDQYILNQYLNGRGSHIK